jgi:lysozyme
VAFLAEELDDKLPWWRKMDEPRQGVLLNMAYNLGVPRLLAFKRALGAMRIGDYARAGTEMLDSRWAREQVRSRAAELARQMVLGDWESRQSTTNTNTRRKWYAYTPDVRCGTILGQ